MFLLYGMLVCFFIWFWFYLILWIERIFYWCSLLVIHIGRFIRVTQPTENKTQIVWWATNLELSLLFYISFNNCRKKISSNVSSMFYLKFHECFYYNQKYRKEPRAPGFTEIDRTFGERLVARRLLCGPWQQFVTRYNLFLSIFRNEYFGVGFDNNLGDSLFSGFDFVLMV